MRRIIAAHDGKAPTPLEPLPAAPAAVKLPLASATNRCELVPCLAAGAVVQAGEVVARADPLALHAPVSGRIVAVAADWMTIEASGAGAPSFSPPPPPTAHTLSDFAAEMGLVGMGGSMFPAAIKLGAAESIHTLVINAVECEPGIEIDQCLLEHALDPVRAGVEAMVEALAIERVILACPKVAVPRLRPLEEPLSCRCHGMANTYPAGAEKLILGVLGGSIPPAGVLPVQQGFLVMSVASLHTVGLRLRTGQPSIERPLSLVTDQATRNLRVPVGTPVQHLLDCTQVPFDPARQFLVAGGVMMGRRVDPESPILKGTNAIFVRARQRRLEAKEEPCILCGSCFDACPLGLHPIGMADRIRSGTASRALRAQLKECFLCGACSAVCPSEIPLVQVFHEGKAWLRK